ncbi:hypothetical protein NC652_038283 [Populus alba x Populus x berolinensis]|uniref:Uncharacterized protein n=1 Tax=Populus alba x Populus x berolinensis TaxID=444605 RepID=A0AAD6PT31_9ROSI|nr:hypothetical protein NC652_038283 [Populus alba x Populus x berolinensis]KAJ6960208.1 hypothetical protein NC653_038292 [Populus alba x Populus x berolinensis]
MALSIKHTMLSTKREQCLVAAQVIDTTWVRVLMVNRVAWIRTNATAREVVNSLSTTVIIIYWNRVGVELNHIILMVDYILR